MSTVLVLALLSVLTGDLPARAEVPAATRSLPGSVTPTTQADLVRGIKALEFQGLSLSPQRRGEIADAILEVSKETKIDPFLLVALARMESDFVGVASTQIQCRTNPKYICSADCGITQHHVTGPGKWVQRYCNELQRDIKQTFRKSAEELVRHVEWCQRHSSNSWWGPLELCVLNRYNQGPYYRRDSQCSSVGEPGQDQASRKELKRRCLIRAAYWKRVLCFHYGAVSGKQLVRSCRYTMNLESIPWFYGEPTRGVMAYTTPPIFRLLALETAQKMRAEAAAAAQPREAPLPLRGPAN
jgi:hypothetical protein